jgi:hypothetical protein
MNLDITSKQFKELAQAQGKEIDSFINDSFFGECLKEMGVDPEELQMEHKKWKKKIEELPE